MKPDRRLVCKAGLALAAGAATGCGSAAMTNGDGGSGGACSGNAVAVGNASDVAMGQAVKKTVQSATVYVCRDANGLYAVDAACTHLQCDVAPKSAADISQGFSCPCHGATYDANGQNPTAPAPKPLTNYQMCTGPTGILVDPTVTVTAGTRLKA